MNKKIKIFAQEKTNNDTSLLYGTNAEYMGRVIYGGIYDPESSLSDEDGYRLDVKKAIGDLKLSMVRFPGGNFVSGYNWKEGVGTNRPVRLNLAWYQTEPNTIGLHENYNYYKSIDVPLYMNINMGLGTIKDGMELVEYCEHKGGTTLSEERISNGQIEPFGFKYWCIGNEMDGWWQMGHMDYTDYAKKCFEMAKMIKRYNPNLKLTACGTSKPTFKWFGKWEKEVIGKCYDYIDYISLHTFFDCSDYYKYKNKSLYEYFGAIRKAEDDIKLVEKIIDKEKKKRKGIKHDVYISYDEWNVWHRVKGISDPNDWQVEARRLECVYDFKDALICTDFLALLMEHSNKVKIACQAQLVNVLSLIFTNKEDMFLQTTYYPYKFCSNYMKGEYVKLSYNKETIRSKSFGSYDKYKVVMVKGIGETGVLAVNLSKDSSYDIEIPVNCDAKIIISDIMQANENDKNSFENKNNVIPQHLESKIENGILSFTLKEFSICMIAFESENEKQSEEMKETNNNVVYC